MTVPVPAGAGGVDRDAIRARCEAATPGPWDWWQTETGCAEMFVPNGTMNTETVLTFADHLDCEECGRPSLADAEFIAHAREDVPALLAALAAAEQRYEELRDERALLWPQAQVLPIVEAQRDAAEQRADTLAAANVSLAERQSGYLQARGHTLSTDGMERDAAIEAQALYVLGEASELHAACKGGTGGWGGTAKHWRCEIADVVLATVTLANILGVTVEDCIEEKTEEDRDRDRAAALSSRPVQPEGKQT